MKIVNFQGGLGNQMFIYTFYLYLRKRFPNERIYGSYWSKSLREHTKFMLGKIFDISLPPHNVITDCVSGAASLMEKLHVVSREENEHSVFFNGFWLDKKYFEGTNLDDVFKFRNTELSEKNAKVRDEILNSNSVAMHVRNGDYLSERYWKDFGVFCSSIYYHRAYVQVKEQMPDAKIFVFSDNQKTTKSKLHLPEDTIYVDGNSGDDSWIDMYLMSLCKHNIIANSTFSWWAATLNANSGKHVFYPKRWYSWENPDIFPSDWTSVDNM